MFSIGFRSGNSGGVFHDGYTSRSSCVVTTVFRIIIYLVSVAIGKTVYER